MGRLCTDVIREGDATIQSIGLDVPAWAVGEDSRKFVRSVIESEREAALRDGGS
jgi:hypothetical protein